MKLIASISRFISALPEWIMLKSMRSSFLH